MASICRLCATLKKVENFVHIHDPNLNLCTKLERCCQLKIQENDVLPQNVCNECVQSLDDSWKFAERVREAQESLHKIFVPEEHTTEVEGALYQKLSGPPANAQIQQIEQTTDDEQKEEFYDTDVGSMKVEHLEAADNETDKEELVDLIEMPEDAIDDDNDAFVEEEDDMMELEQEPQNVDDSQTWKDYPWKCKLCSTSYSSVFELREHFTAEHKQLHVQYICADCSKTFDKYYTFINHVRIRHRPYLAYCCDICSEVYRNSTSLANHHCTTHEGEHFNLCPTCGKGFKNAKALQLHSTCHQPEDVRYKHACHLCGKKFGTKPNLKAHLKIHAGLREFVCDQCGKSFVQKANLEEHLLTHVNDKPYECQDCGKTFKTPARLAKHKTVHTDVKSHKCDECGRMFREKDTLRVHLRIHTGAMPYECEYCGKRFRFRSILVTHRHQHTGVRPYSCVGCNHHFTNWPNYNKHMKRVHGINTSLSARKPQTIPPTGLPPNAKQHYVVPFNNPSLTESNSAILTPEFTDSESANNIKEEIKVLSSGKRWTDDDGLT